MTKQKLSRRDFIGKTAAGLASVTMTGAVASAASYRRIRGSNDRVNIGFLGCGSRSRDHLEIVKNSEKDKNMGAIAVCDLWKFNRERHASICKKIFGADVKQFKYSE